MILWTVQRAASPPDDDHPYGHGKMESLASLIQIILICGSASYILVAAWNRLQAPAMPRIDWGVGALSLAIVVDFFVSRHLKIVARETGSQAIAAEAVHLQSDMISCAGVLLGLGAVWLTREPRLDPLIAGLMAFVVIGSSLKLARETVRPLLDEKLPGDEEAQIIAVLDADPRVLSYHRLRTRQAGSHRLMDVHLLLDDNLSFRQSHAIVEEVEDAIRRILPNLDIIVHAEPFEEEMRHQQEEH
jgi:cation diffusion facilitator family transporter